MQRRVWGWDRQVLSSVAFLHVHHPCLWILPRQMIPHLNTVHREIDRSCLYIYSVCVCERVCACLTTSEKLSLGEINRCDVQLVVRDYSQRCDSISPQARAVVLFSVHGEAESGAKYKPWTQPTWMACFSFNCICSLTTMPFRFQLRGTRAVWQLQCWIHCHLDCNRVCSHAGFKYSWSKNTGVYSMFLFKQGTV